MHSDAPVKEIKLMAVGNSRGLRLPRELLRRYHIADTLIVEERPDGILLRGNRQDKVSLEQTFAGMAAEREDWSDMERARRDGLNSSPW
ncbi:MAG: hypothetical protein LH632_13925 [Rhodoferax sp.]|nr:hypothetical protein [Rhodoferax sp.]